ncbi:MAG: DUF58 domain-containing protein [Butyrivibrio sp.]
MSVIIYILAAVGIFAFNILDDTYAPYVFDAAFFVISVVCLITAIRLHFGVSVELEENSHAVRGQKYLIRFRVKNTSPIPVLWGKVKFSVKTMGSKRKLLKKQVRVKMNFSCSPRQTQFFEYVLESAHCEVVAVSLKRFTTWDFLHIFGFGKKSKSSCDIVVMPDSPGAEITGKMSAGLSNGDSEIYSTVRPGNDPTEIFGVREYEGGDKIRSIHWKLSSKAGELMVKEYGLPLTDRDYVVIDLFGEDHELRERVKLEDEMYELLYGLTAVMTARGFGFNAVYFNGQYNAVRVETQTDIENLFVDLYGIKPYGADMSAAGLFAAYNREKIQRRIFYITPYYNDMVVGNMNVLSESGMVYYLIPGHVSDSRLPVKYHGQRGK